MELEIDTSSNQVSEFSNSTIQTGQSRTKSSAIHEHTRSPRQDEPVRNEKNVLLYYCKYDNRSFASTNGLWYHLRKEHGIERPESSNRTKAAIAVDEHHCAGTMRTSEFCLRTMQTSTRRADSTATLSKQHLL